MYLAPAALGELGHWGQLETEAPHCTHLRRMIFQTQVDFVMAGKCKEF